MKVVKILVVVLLAGIIGTIIFLYSAFSNTTWGGWRPPPTDLEFNAAESLWKSNLEEKYNCQVSFVGLDNGYREDSIIYIQIDCKQALRSALNDEAEKISEEIANSFLSASQTRRKQDYVSIDYLYGDSYAIDRSFIYSAKEKMILPEN